ncbi:MAG: histidine kinase dimerization/phospho-acceptor domain-containing protein [Micropruina glycogenica]
MTPPVRPLAKGTLGRRLVVRVAVLVAVVAIGLSTVVALAAYNIQISQIDNRLGLALNRQTRPDDGGRGGPSPGGQVIGTITAVQTGGTASGVILVDKSSTSAPVGFETLSTDAVSQLTALTLTDSSRTTVQLTGYGLYRVAAATDGTNRVIVGIPLNEVASAMTSLLLFEALLAGVVIIGAVVVASSVVVNSLAPLNRLAATATTVSNLPLESGEVEGIVRVPQRDTDPVSEVGRVGLAFNHMLDNVEGALAARHASEVKLRQFVADASHELRNPLAAIRGYAELTRRERDQVSDTMSHALTRIESESDRMSTLVEDLLLLARLDSGPALDVRATDLTEIVLNATSDARVAGPDHTDAVAARRARLCVGRSVPAASGVGQPVGQRPHPHPCRHHRANCGHRRRRTGRAHRHRQRPGHLARASVAGVRTVHPGRLESRAQAGRVVHRVRLAIVAAVVAAHRGTASVQSEPGHTVFTVTLPIAPAP